MLATWMDARFSVLGIRFGMDSIIGLVPGVGDALAAAISCYPLHVALKHQLGRGLMVRMGINIAIDLAVGIIPIAGDAVDVVYRVNLKNLALLEKAAKRRLG
jgi:hypothetical protein